MAELTKEDTERRYFEVLAPLAGLSVVPGSISQPSPPAPDILCEISGQGPLAVEMVSIDDETTRTRLRHMRVTRVAWEIALAPWPQEAQAQLRADTADVYFNFDFENQAGRRERVIALKAVQRLMSDSPGFAGRVLPAAIGQPRGLVGATVFRGGVTDGPGMSASSGGYWQQPQVDKIAGKLRDKRYQTSAPLELFAYSTHDEPNLAVGSLEQIQETIVTLLPGSPFRRVHVFDAAFLRYLLKYPAQ